ncbi:NADP-dependent oxidoreductase [Stackebrandtia nassauensis]|uniref:Alcohol dehydrogenase GroES domain protein n=1 Tax=Stackebrandtia nassauensis (strain DSM 44728 / CIP 108903 / NRRL B-16338 / NBRC 102104 / LLR-40K-21) TaxID=446470 RepID=D3PZC7_STANL|nr:NADP-dependent oxidoreductase [Stackebrandtia nassauensis]ADD41601.1 Alcohol dehydrogenase GroES domain protein [Stackebrandtia nassauensis DSM 44728]
MYAVGFDEYGDASVLRYGEHPKPSPGPGQVRIEVRAAAVNPYDWKLRSGMMREIAPVTFPFIPGGEAAGVVDEVGEGVTGVEVGDEVFGLGSGTYAQYALLNHVAPKPAGFDWHQAAGTALAAETALRSLRLVELAAGQTLVVDGASGSVGSAAVQLAVADGATVIGTCGSSNEEFVSSLGARPVRYGPGLADRVRAMTAHVDAGFDTVGHGGVAELIELTGTPGKVVTVADFSGEHDVHVTSVPSAFDALAKVAELARGDGYVVRVGRTFPLAEAEAAHRCGEAGISAGKIVLTLE